MEQATKNNITNAPLFKAMFKYFMPIFLGSIIQQSYSFADALLIGNFAGWDAIAAIDACYPYVKLMINVFIAVGMGGSILIAQYYGASDEKKVSEVVNTLIPFSIIGGIVITLLSIGLSPFFSDILNIPEDILSSSLSYLRIYFLGTVFSFVYNIGAGVLRAVGDTKRPFYYLIISSAINIALDALFIGVFNWGVKGAATATIISQFISSMLIISTLTKTNECYKYYIKKIVWFPNHLIEIFKLGIPVGAQSALYSIANIYTQSAINSFGTLGVSGWAICGKMDFIIWSMSDAISITVMTFVAQNFGAKKKIRVQRAVYVGMALGIMMISPIVLILYFGVEILTSLFTKDMAVIAMTSDVMHLIAPYYVIYMLGTIISGQIKGYGKTLDSMLLSLIGVCLFRIFWIYYILPMNKNILFALTVYPVSWWVTLGIFVIYAIIFKIFFAGKLFEKHEVL